MFINVKCYGVKSVRPSFDLHLCQHLDVVLFLRPHLFLLRQEMIVTTPLTPLNKKTISQWITSLLHFSTDLDKLELEHQCCRQLKRAGLIAPNPSVVLELIPGFLWMITC